MPLPPAQIPYKNCQLSANSRLSVAQHPQLVLDFIFLRFAKVRFAAQRANLERTARELAVGLLLCVGIVLPSAAADGLTTDERGQLLLRATPFHGIGANTGG